jgi:hypothetical protein
MAVSHHVSQGVRNPLFVRILGVPPITGIAGTAENANRCGFDVQEWTGDVQKSWRLGRT